MSPAATAPKLTTVRVLPLRSLSLGGGAGNASVHHVPGDVIELPAEEAKQLIEDGIVEKA